MQSENVKLKIIFLGILFFAIFGLAKSSRAATYYIAANGSDSNDGISKNTPWIHAPGMLGCSGNCATKITNILPGDQFILKGGDTWYMTGAGTPVGVPWVWYPNGHGTSDNRIYIGVDKTWYSGSQWARPVLSGGNPPSTSPVTSCTYPEKQRYCVQNGNACGSDNDCPGGWGCPGVFLSVNWSQYVTIDNIEFTGGCLSPTSVYSGYLGNGQNGAPLPHSSIVKNVYMHGLSVTSAVTADYLWGAAGDASADTDGRDIYENDIFDFSDSPPAKVWGIGGDINDVHGSSFINLYTAIDGGHCRYIYNNLISDTYTLEGQHADVFQCESPKYHNLYMYNNTVRRYNNAVEWLTYAVPEVYGVYTFNNLIYGPTSNEPFSVDSKPGGYMTNNTFANMISYGCSDNTVTICKKIDDPCGTGGTCTDTGGHTVAGGEGEWNGYIKNNLWINTANPDWFSWGGNVAETYALYLDSSQGNTAGYTCTSGQEAAGKCYQQTSPNCSGNPSLCGVGQGQNLTNTLVCSDDTAASCSTLGAACVAAVHA